MRFGHLKTHHGFERMRLRDLTGARDEFPLAAIVQNPKTMALRLLKPPEPVSARVASLAVSRQHNVHALYWARLAASIHSKTQRSSQAGRAVNRRPSRRHLSKSGHGRVHICTLLLAHDS